MQQEMDELIQKREKLFAQIATAMTDFNQEKSGKQEDAERIKVFFVIMQI